MGIKSNNRSNNNNIPDFNNDYFNNKNDYYNTIFHKN